MRELVGLAYDAIHGTLVPTIFDVLSVLPVIE